MKLFSRIALDTSFHSGLRKGSNFTEDVSDTTSSSESPRTLITKENFLQHDEMEAMENIAIFCKEKRIRLASNEIFRIACFYDFQLSKTKKAIEREQKNPFLRLRVDDDLEEYMDKQILFPVQDLKTKNNLDVIYLRPSRHFPEHTPTINLTNNLCYVMNDLSRTEEQCRNGVALIANLDEFTMNNLRIDCCHQFMQAVQGNFVPTKMELALIVDPPSYFKQAWKIIRPMLASSFAKKVHVIKREQLSDYLMDGYIKFLPDELGGLQNTAALVDEYIKVKLFEEENDM